MFSVSNVTVTVTDASVTHNLFTLQVRLAATAAAVASNPETRIKKFSIYRWVCFLLLL